MTIASTEKYLYLLPSLAVVTLLLFGTPGVASLPGGPGSSGEAVAGAPAAGDVSRRRCPECGVIASMRKIEPGGLGVPGQAMAVHPAGRYEFTVRLDDGSQRLITDANPASWRIGERVNIIDGISPARR